MGLWSFWGSLIFGGQVMTKRLLDVRVLRPFLWGYAFLSLLYYPPSTTFLLMHGSVDCCGAGSSMVLGSAVSRINQCIVGRVKFKRKSVLSFPILS